MGYISKKECCFCGLSGVPLIRTKIGILCHKHESQYKRLGYCKDKTFMDKNDIIDNGDGTSSIVATDKNMNIMGYVIIDTEDVDIVKDHKWRIGTDNKVSSSFLKADGSRKTTMLHRFLTNCPDNLVVDHIDGNRLNNRRSNLRICTQKQNRHNLHKVSKRGTNPYVGVKKLSPTKWEAYIYLEGKRITLGRFSNPEDAYAKRREAEKNHFGEFMSSYQEPRYYN